MQNEAKYDLDRKTAKISALSFNNLDKYEYLPGEDLSLKPSTVEQAKLDYSSQGKIFNKGLDKDKAEKKLSEKIKKEKNDIDPEKFVCVKTDGTIFNFNQFKNSIDLASNIYRDKKLLKDAENEQHDIKVLLNKLRNYNPTKPKKIKVKQETLSAAEKILNNKQEVIDAFKRGTFPYIDGFQIKEESEEESEEKSQKNKR